MAGSPAVERRTTVDYFTARTIDRASIRRLLRLPAR
jgi:hypothetical protein